ncbi:hypothetical protein LXL04_038612 [Taraxacum kok-saghyz]
MHAWLVLRSLNKLESTRRNFFWGGSGEPNQRKIPWVAWSQMLNRKEKGGLNIGILRALSYALLAKWWWRFRAGRAGLWKDVIIALYGHNGSIGETIPATRSSTTWGRICNIKKELSELNINLDMLMTQDSGGNTGTNGWSWTLESNDIFTVRSLRSHVDSKLLKEAAVPTIWTNITPIKANILIWRMRLNRFPTRSNLLSKGINTPDPNCPWCLLGHIFVYRFDNKSFFRNLENQKKKKKNKSLYNHPDLMAYNSPKRLLDECMKAIDLKDQDLCQKQEEIEDLKKKISDLEEKLAEKETQKKCFSSMSVQTEEEEVYEISFSRNPVSNTEESYTEESSHTEEASATDDTRFVKSTEKSKESLSDFEMGDTLMVNTVGRDSGVAQSLSCGHLLAVRVKETTSISIRTSIEVFAYVAAWASSIGFLASPIVIDDFLVHQPHSNKSKAKEVWDSISRALLWSLWFYRNELVFEGKVKTTMELVMEVKRTAFMWSKIRSKNLKNVDWDK